MSISHALQPVSKTEMQNDRAKIRDLNFGAISGAGLDTGQSLASSSLILFARAGVMPSV
jgi:hypothetical protein